MSILTVYYASIVEITNYYAVTVEIAVITRVLSKSRFIYQEERKMYYKDNQNEYIGNAKYCEYRDLQMFERTYPKRCAEYIQGIIPCEYYTVPRTLHEEKPQGYSAYKYKYDVNNAGELVRVGIRIPKYGNDKESAREENMFMIDERYSFKALELLHHDFCDPACTIDILRKKYPLKNNTSTDAYNLLLPWAKANRIFPDYPRKFDYLWFVQLHYKKSTLTFCIAGVDDKEPELFDIIENNDFRDLYKLQNAYEWIRDMEGRTISICLDSDIKLYRILKDIFPDAIYIYNVFQIQTVLKDCLGKLKGEERSTCTMHERKLRHVLQELEAGRESKERVKSECVPVINYLLQSKNKVINQEIELIRQGLEEILRGKNDFIDQFFEVERFHSSMIQKLQVLMKTFMKTRGYEPNRLVYMILSYVKNMKKIEPYSCYEVPMYLAEERRSYGKIKTSNAAISKLIKYVYKLDSIIEKKVK